LVEIKDLLTAPGLCHFHGMMEYWNNVLKTITSVFGSRFLGSIPDHVRNKLSLLVHEYFYRFRGQPLLHGNHGIPKRIVVLF
jgi:transposase InsO family protein